MSEYLGKLHETVMKFPMTDIWMDSCGEEELDYGVERGIVGCTSNPQIISTVIKNEISIWEPRIKELCVEMPDATEDDIAYEIIYEAGALRSKKLLPVYEKWNGKKGRLSVQTNPKFYRNADKMVEQAMKIDSLAPNMMIKMPGDTAGIDAIEEATYRGASINCTVCFSVAQSVAAAEAVERGLNRRKAEGLPTENMGPVCTIMIGRVDDWLKKYVSANGIIVDPECLEWAGIAVIKKAYKIFKERGYTTRLLAAAYRNHRHWSELIGGELSMTIPYEWHKRFNASDVEVVSRIDDPVPEEWMNELLKLDDFHKAFDEDGMAPEDFVKYGAFRNTINGFLDGYDNLCKMVRGYMV